MKIGTRLILGFCACLACIVVLGGIGIYAVRSVAAKGNKVVEVDARIVENAYRVRANINVLRRYEKDAFMNIGTPDKVEEYVKKWEESRDQGKKRMDLLLKLETEPKDKELLADLNKKIDLYGEGFSKVVSQIKSGAITTTQDANKAIGEYKEATHHIEKSIVSYATSNDENIIKAKDKLKADVQRVVIFMSVVVVISFIVVVVLVTFLIRSIMGPLKQISALANDIAQGDLTKRLSYNGKDELGDICTSFNTSTEKLYNLNPAILFLSLKTDL
jgi:methyl-accepting chemotaxis protein